MASRKKGCVLLEDTDDREACVRLRAALPQASGQPDSFGPTSSDHPLVDRRLGAVRQLPPHAANPRMDRIAAIRRAIATGSYSVSAADVAQSLIRHMLRNHPPLL